MKKILSLLLVVIMVVSMIPTAYAVTPVCEMCGSTGDFTNPHMHVGRDGSYCVACGHCEACADNDECYCSYCNTTEVGNGTQVSFNAEADNDGDGQPDSVESYTVTVPAQLAPAGSGDVVAQGTWSSARKLIVTADKDVTLTNSINAADQKVLDVTFPGISLVGSNTAAVTDTKVVSVADIEAALFGTWEGVFEYNVEMVDNVDLISFTVDTTNWEATERYATYQAEGGMTWNQWINSDYNVDGWYITDGTQNITACVPSSPYPNPEHALYTGTATDGEYGWEYSEDCEMVTADMVIDSNEQYFVWTCA